MRNTYKYTKLYSGGETANDKAGEMQEKYPLLEGGLAIERVAAIKQGNWVPQLVITKKSHNSDAANKHFNSNHIRVYKIQL